MLKITDFSNKNSLFNRFLDKLEITEEGMQNKKLLTRVIYFIKSNKILSKK